MTHKLVKIQEGASTYFMVSSKALMNPVNLGLSFET